MENSLKDLKQRVRRKLPFLTNSQKAVANYVVENPQQFALSSVRELEETLHTSKSTIVRLAQALGYEGFYDMKSAFLKGVRREWDPIHRFKSFLAEPTGESDYLKLIAEETVNNIKTTLMLIDKEQYRRAVNLIEGANHVYSIGMGISTYLAELAAYLFGRVSIKSHSMTYGGFTFAEQIINLSPEDVILVFSFPPYSQEPIQAARYAQEKQIKVIAVTDKVTSEIVQHSDVALQVMVESVTISKTIMAALGVIYAITAQLGHELRDKTLETIETIERLRMHQSEEKS